MTRYETMLRHLKKMAAAIARSSELAEAKAVEIDAYVRLMFESGALPDRAILGRVLYTARYDDPDRCDSAIVYQAAIVPNHGIGCINWDLEEYAACREEGRLEQAATIHFEPFCDCTKLVRALLLPEVGRLLAEVVKRLPIDPCQPDL